MFILTLLLLDLLKENAYAADTSVYCPDNGFTDNTVTYLTGSFNSSVSTIGKCLFGVSVVNFVFIKGTSKPDVLCTQPFSTSPLMCNMNFTTQNCKCDNVTGDMFYYTYRFTTNATVHQGGVMELTTDCKDINGFNPLTSETCSLIIITTTASTTTEGSTLTTIPPPTAPPPFPGWKIALIVIGIVIFIAIIIAIVVFIIKKCKKEEQQGNRKVNHPAPGGNNRTELTPNPPPEGNIRTELTLNPAPGGNNRTELTIQDATEMQDRNKHLGTNNSPEKEKRRKKKKKKKTFEEVDGEPVSREDKSTVNDHKAAQNDNSVYINESSHGIDNGGHRSLPMPKASHLTPVERNSTIVKSETPRKLPPLQLKQ